MTRRLLATALAFATVGMSARADVKLPAIFGSHMVLQQKENDKVWGWAEPGEEVTVTIAGQTKTAKAGDDKKWSVTLDPLTAGGEPLTMTVKGKNTITFDDVLVGEVWICSGQSNMQMRVADSNDADMEVQGANFPKIRLITVPTVGTQTPKDNFNGSWTVCTPKSVGGFSGVGYFFGRQLYETLGVPIGLIHDSWGGSSCETWINKDVMTKDGKYTALLERWKGKEAGTDNQQPGNLYNGMILPVKGYGIKGAIWYQGETNAGRAYQYRDLFPLMIKNWRDEWGIGDFPFYWVQLADYMGENPQPEESGWAELREAQTMAMSKLPNTGQAVIIDIGEGKDIHPKNKVDVGKRLARWALAKDYGIKVATQGPMYKSMEVKDGKVIVKFENVNGVLRPFDVNELKGFTIAGADKKFFNAKGKIVGSDSVELSAEGVKEPVAVRYAWANNPVCNLFDNLNLPACPFRTDDWPGVTINNK
jgi:sialate O-acetylesterase